tara:strand:+ start:639 stop:860 length:222 start_codon:yes stop_codon:yes gene_type:complete
MSLQELKKSFKTPKGETLITSFDVGKKPNTIDAHVTKKGNVFTAYLDGDKLDTYTSEKAAVKAAKELSNLMGD